MKKREGTEFSQANEKYKNIKGHFHFFHCCMLEKWKYMLFKWHDSIAST